MIVGKKVTNLLSVGKKMFVEALTCRAFQFTEKEAEAEQCGFRKKISCTEQVFVIRLTCGPKKKIVAIFALRDLEIEMQCILGNRVSELRWRITPIFYILLAPFGFYASSVIG